MSEKAIAPVKWIESLGALPALRESERWLAAPEGRWSVGGAAGSSRALLVAALWQRTGRPLLVLTKDQNTMYAWLEDLQFFAEQLDLPPAQRILPLPHPETLPYELREPDPAVQAERLGTLRELLLPSSEAPLIVVAPVRTLLRRFPPLAFWREKAWPLRVGKTLNREAFVGWLSSQGYEFRELVCAPGEYSVRGGIVDVFPPDAPEPLRIELFGDEIDSLRLFDLATQRSTARLKAYDLLPSDEDELMQEAIARGGGLPSLVEELCPGFQLVMDEWPEIEVEAARVISLAEKMYREAQALQRDTPGEMPARPLLPPEQRYLNWADFQQTLEACPSFFLSSFSHAGPAETGTNLGASSMNLPAGPHKTKLARLLELAQAGQQVWIACDNEGQRHRLEELLQDESLSAEAALLHSTSQISAEASLPHSTLGGAAEAGLPHSALERIRLVVGGLHQGFALPALGWNWTTDREIFGRYRRVRQRLAKGIALPIVDLVDLKPGDFVVHVEQGIARYRCLKMLTVEGRSGEFLELEYAEGDTLYVPIEQIERVGRYIGSSAAPPKLSKLGGKAWQSAKAKARQAIENMAGELLELYAERSVRTGHVFQRDTPWQYEFEASFIFDETADQLRSIEEVKRDMESPRPMDRLICGDVGFGKTEVALRAAFKAVMDGRQVALLVPTTVLAEQHYRTFSERLADYPVAVEVLSRFRSRLEQHSALEALGEGKIDILIGTHRLLQKDVRFRDLGLVIIDEEQRFGVKHKERLKQMRTLVDVLTMTATPIPRTLYMSLGGVRDMSLVNTPPKDRQPIQTYVYDWSREVIESAILREMARGGQVYFVHNRVESIGAVAAQLQQIVPEARIAIGHGQMAEKELARVMRDFIDRRYDVLLSTTIIGSGLDIPSVNTIVIDRADTFGLADLYQLRGRVGRDRHRAYCYLLVPSRGMLSRVAKQRLLAIQEFNQLGSGFQLALRDMEIRGMGNLLGREQHGHIAALGFDLYSRLLADAVDQLTGKQRHLFPEPQVELAPGDAEGRGEISPQYVPSARLRMSLYKRLAGLRELAAVEEYEKEIADLYGTPPPETQRLIDAQRLRILAWQAGIDLVRVGAGRAQLRYCEEAAHHHFSPERVLELDRLVEGQLTVSIRDGVLLTFQPAAVGPSRADCLLSQVKILLERIGEHARKGRRG